MVGPYCLYDKDDAAMSLKEKLSVALWTSKVVRKTLQSTGVSQETTFAGLRAAVIGLVQARKLGPAGAMMVHAANHPHRECLIDKYRRLTYQEATQETVRLADGLLRIGCRPKDTVGIMLKNRSEFLLIANAAARIGCPVVQLSHRLKAEEAGYILDNANAKYLFFEDSLAALVRRLPEKAKSLHQSIAVSEAEGFLSYKSLGAQGDPKAKPPRLDEDPKLLIYTSGTTGKPKGAARKTGLSVLGPTMAFLDALGLKSDDRHLAVCPLYHSAGVGFAVFTLLLGGTVVILEHFDAEEVLRKIEQERLTTAMMVPTMYRRLVDLPREVFQKYDTSSLRRLVTGAALMPVPLQEAIAERFGHKLCDFYGSTETGWNTLAGPEDLRRKPGSIGKVIEGNQIKLLDKQGVEVRQGEVGQLYVRSMMQIEGYHADDEATQASMRDGFFSVGDLAYQDAEGYYFLAGRKTDMVISGGVNIYPKEVEDGLHQHPAVIDAAVIGVPHDEWGEALRAFLVLRPEIKASEAEIKAFCKEKMADFKCPREIYFVDELPRNPTGKVLKKDLKLWDPNTPWPWSKGADAAVNA
jgi:fatty-acyl-CoA synthase